ncbi:MAG: hypothetical protein M3Y22_05380 [Pseudomonadota bacterium]|nr:hypothetical protein [Pseudomonadota bacterium]
MIEDHDAREAAFTEEALAVPVEIRTPDSALVARGTVDAVDQAVGALAPGEYHIGVTLPSGEKVERSVTLGKTLEGGIESLRGLVSEWPAIKDHVAGRVTDALAATVTIIDAEDQAQIVLPGGARATRGGQQDEKSASSVLRSVGLVPGSGVNAALTAARRIKAVGHDILVERPAGAAAVTVQVIDPNLPPFNVVVPPCASLIIGVDDDGDRLVTLRTGLANADDLLRLRGSQRLDEVTSILESLGPAAVQRHSELLLSGALVIAYGLLRSATQEQMREAAQHLLVARPDDPDVLAIAGEVWARDGNHVAAMRCFLDALTYGLPAFSFGLNYCTERLRLYTIAKIGVEDAQRPEMERLIERCRDQYRTVQGFAMKMDFESAITGYEGRDPANPLAPRPTLNRTALISAGAAIAATTWLGIRALRNQQQPVSDKSGAEADT